jgi:hypothetical protein
MPDSRCRHPLQNPRTAKKTVSARGKGKEKAKIVYLSDDGEDDFIEDDVSEYEDFEGDDDNVSLASRVLDNFGLLFSLAPRTDCLLRRCTSFGRGF